MPVHKHAPLNSFIPFSSYFHLLSTSPSAGFSSPTKGFVSVSWQAFGAAQCTLGFTANLVPSIESVGSGLGMLHLAEEPRLAVPHGPSVGLTGEAQI